MKNAFKSVLFLLILVMSAAFVFAAPTAPAVNPIPDQSANEGYLLTVPFTATAADAGAATSFSACLLTSATGACTAAYTTGNLAVGSSVANVTTLTATSGQFNWNPLFGQAGTYYFNLSVSDTDSTNTTTFKVTVNRVSPSMTISPSPVAFGSDTQERSDPNQYSDSRREINISTSVTLTNNGEPIRGITGAVTFASGFATKDIMANFTLPQVTLGTGQSMTFPVSVRVPQQLDAVDNTDTPIAVKVGALSFTAIPTVTTSTPITTSADMNLQAENNLEIKNVKVKFEGKSNSVRNGDTVKNMKPGDDVEFDIEIANRFTTRQDVTIENIQVSALSDNAIGIDDSTDAADLSAGESDTVTLTTTIDSGASDGTYSVMLTADGTDEFGARHGQTWTIDFQVKRQSHEIDITSVTVTPSTVTCEKSATLITNIKNSGRNDENEVFVRASSPNLNFGTVSDKLSLNRDDTETVSFNIPVPSSVTPGIYHIDVTTYYNTGTLSQTDGTTLTVSSCQPVTPPPVTPPPQNVTVITIPPPATNVTAQPTTKPFFQTPQYLALLALGYLVVIGGGAAIIVRLLRK